MNQDELDKLMVEIIEAEYEGLFGFGTQEANEVLNLPQNTDEETRRDHLGIMALEAISEIEGVLTKVIRDMDEHTLPSVIAIELTRFAARTLGDAYRKHVHSGRQLLKADLPDKFN